MSRRLLLGLLMVASVPMVSSAAPAVPDPKTAKLDAENGFRDAKFGTPLAKFKGMELVNQDDDNGLKSYQRKTDALAIGTVTLKAIQYGFDAAGLLQVIRLEPAEGQQYKLRGEMDDRFGFSEASRGWFRTIGARAFMAFDTGAGDAIILSTVAWWERNLEAQTKGNLNSIQAAISIFYGDNEGIYPGSIIPSRQSVMALYLEQIPPVKMTHMGIGSGTADSPEGRDVLITDDEKIATPGKGWRYNPRTGRVFVNSSATDSRGVPYSTYGY